MKKKSRQKHTEAHNIRSTQQQTENTPHIPVQLKQLANHGNRIQSTNVLAAIFMLEPSLPYACWFDTIK